MKKIKVGLISLGCEKNLVDSEMILGVCKEAGFEIETDLNLSAAKGVALNALKYSIKIKI